MANEAHLAMLKQGVADWNQWCKENQTVTPSLRIANRFAADLFDAALSGAALSGAALFAADLRGADLRGAILSDADLRGADLSGATLSDADLRGANLSRAVLRGATLRGTNLSRADLRSATLFTTALRGATLSDADLSRANLSDADLRGADLSRANLSRANLSRANLSRANLSHSNLSGTDLSAAILSHVDFTDTQVGGTVFGNVDLAEVKGLETVRHGRPSSIGIDTIYLSKGNIPYKFLLDAGIPKDDISYLLSLAGKAIDFYSCFISCSSKDQAFAKRLHADLQARGVRCWVAWEDLTIGEPILSGIDKGIRLHDKLLLVLSTDSVTSRWVEHEVEAALVEELRPDRKAKMLFPIRLDNAVMETAVDWANRIRQTRHIGDFIQWKDHDSYQKAFNRLLRDLKMESEK